MDHPNEQALDQNNLDLTQEENELNQQGRPKQRVIFYELT